jgi:O-antigen ligase
VAQQSVPTAPDINGEIMRPGLVFVGLFAVLILVYVLLLDSLGTLGTFLLQAAIVLVVLAGATWFRYAKHRTGWLFFGDEEHGEPQDSSAESESDGSTDEFRKAG